MQPLAMPLSHRRKPKAPTRSSWLASRKPSAPYGDLTIESTFDRAHAGTGLKGPEVLYHYTSWQAAESIVGSQKFWATAHDSTNDPAELVTADATMLDAFRSALSHASGMTAEVLRLFLDRYEQLRLSASARCYLVCFSERRDDLHQWREYGQRGDGVCLGLRLFRIPEPRVAELTSAFMPVEYREVEWRRKFGAWLDEFMRIMSTAEATDRTRQLALDTLAVNTAAFALTVKMPKWEAEHEVRMVFLVRKTATVEPLGAKRVDGTIRRYLSVPVTNLKRMPIVEITVGPGNDPREGSERAREILDRAGYRDPDSRIVFSSVDLGDP
jgi:hypothetical protein